MRIGAYHKSMGEKYMDGKFVKGMCERKERVGEGELAFNRW